MSETIRSFIAIALPEEIRSRLAEVQALLRPVKESGRARLSIPRAENIHLTLKFLGDIPVNTVGEIDERVGEKLRDAGAFELSVRGAGGFPQLMRPRVLWAGVKLTDKLRQTQALVESGLKGMPIKLDRKAFRPHLTIARVRNSRQGELGDVLKPFLAFEFGSFTVEEIVLYRSELAPSGAIYSPLVRWSL